MASRGRPKDPDKLPRRTVSFRLLEHLYEEAQVAAHIKDEPLTNAIERYLSDYVRQQRHKAGEDFDLLLERRRKEG